MTDPTQVNGHRDKGSVDVGTPSAGCGSSGSQVTQTKRGKRSQLSVEQREHNRRLKKQNIERRRRACISDKMTDLHRLAMGMIGCENPSNLKIEKADILGTCHNVFQNVANILFENPEMRARLLELTKPLRIKLLAIDNEHGESRSAQKRNNAQKAFSSDVENIDPLTSNTWRSNARKSEIDSTPHQRMKTPSAFTFTQSGSRFTGSTVIRAFVNQTTPDNSGCVMPASQQWPSGFHHSPVDVLRNFCPKSSHLSGTPSWSVDSGVNLSQDSFMSPPSLHLFDLGGGGGGGATPLDGIQQVDKLWRPYLD